MRLYFSPTAEMAEKRGECLHLSAICHNVDRGGLMVMNVADRLNKIQTTIGQACQKSNRNIQDITIIGVTKYVTIERAKETIDAGVTNLGENRLDEFLEKY